MIEVARALDVGEQRVDLEEEDSQSNGSRYEYMKLVCYTVQKGSHRLATVTSTTPQPPSTTNICVLYD